MQIHQIVIEMLYYDTKNISILIFLLVSLIQIEIHSRCEIHELK